MPSALVFHRLTVRRGDRDILADVTLDVPEGTLFAVLGANGAGKSTLIRVALGLLRPTSGHVRALECAMPTHAARAMRAIGYVPDRPHLPPFLSVGETLAVHRQIHRGWDASLASRLKERFRLESAARVDDLSKGGAAALTILLALAQRPRLLVLDEPTDGLDPLLRREAIASILEYASEASATVVMATHQLGEAERLCDTLAVLDGGRVIAGGPLHAFRDGFRVLRVRGPFPAVVGDAPFGVLSRTPRGGEVEDWVVRGWQEAHRDWCPARGMALDAVHPLDLEEGVVELLRLSRGMAA